MPNGYAFTEFVYNDRKGKPLMEKWIVEEMKHAWSGGAAGVPTRSKGADAARKCAVFSQSPINSARDHSFVASSIFVAVSIAKYKSSVDRPRYRSPFDQYLV